MAKSRTSPKQVRRPRKPALKPSKIKASGDRAEVWVHVKYPPEEIVSLSRFRRLPNLYEGYRPFFHSPLGVIGSKFSVTPSPSPLQAIQAMVLAHDLGLYPPKAVLAWLAERFRHYLVKGAAYRPTSPSLDRIFGLIGRGKENRRGQRRLWHTEALKMRDMMLCSEIETLRKEFGVSITQAARMVAARAKGNWDYPPPLTPETIKQRYLHDWKQWRKSLTPVVERRKNFGFIRAEYLRGYPLHVLPDNLKPELDEE